MDNSLRQEAIRTYLSKINFKTDRWSYNTIEEDMKKFLGERPTLDVRYEKDAFLMLKNLSGKEHSVFTGVTVIKNDKEVTFGVQTKVKFFELDDREIEDYISSGEPFDKAGAYGIQGKGSLFVEKIDGDYFNVVGLPISRLARQLKSI